MCIRDRISTFAPTLSELERARQNYANDANQSYVSAFSAQIVLGQMSGAIDPLYLTRLQSRDVVRAMDLTKVQEQWTQLIKTSNKEFVLVGPFAQSDFDRLKTAAQTLSPGVLDDATTKTLWERTN